MNPSPSGATFISALARPSPPLRPGASNTSTTPPERAGVLRRPSALDPDGSRVTASPKRQTASAPPPFETVQRWPPSGNGWTYTSFWPDSLDVYASHRPSGEKPQSSLPESRIGVTSSRFVALARSRRPCPPRPVRSPGRGRQGTTIRGWGGVDTKSARSSTSSGPTPVSIAWRG